MTFAPLTVVSPTSKTVSGLSRTSLGRSCLSSATRASQAARSIPTQLRHFERRSVATSGGSPAGVTRIARPESESSRTSLGAPARSSLLICSYAATSNGAAGRASGLGDAVLPLPPPPPVGLVGLESDLHDAHPASAR